MIDRLIRVAVRRGLRQGLGDGNRLWMVLGTAAVTVRVVQRLTRDSATVVREDLAPGQTLVITHLAKPS